MRAVIQRVSRAEVLVAGQEVGTIGAGALVLLGISRKDSERDARYLAEKIVNLRIFDDEQGRMNLSLKETGGSVLVVSQFTLLGDCRKGRRPSYGEAAPPELARPLYQRFVAAIDSLAIPVATGAFQAEMEVRLVNQGPVTLLLDSKKLF